MGGVGPATPLFHIEVSVPSQESEQSCKHYLKNKIK
jgi:hypothetical protein